MSPGCLPGELFQACPTGIKPRGRPRTCWGQYITLVFSGRVGQSVWKEKSGLPCLNSCDPNLNKQEGMNRWGGITVRASHCTHRCQPKSLSGGQNPSHLKEMTPSRINVLVVNKRACNSAILVGTAVVGGSSIQRAWGSSFRSWEFYPCWRTYGWRHSQSFAGEPTINRRQGSTGSQMRHMEVHPSVWEDAEDEASFSSLFSFVSWPVHLPRHDFIVTRSRGHGRGRRANNDYAAWEKVQHRTFNLSCQDCKLKIVSELRYFSSSKCCFIH